MSAQNIGFGRKLALGAGDFGFNLYWQMAQFFLLFFYTDVLKLDPVIAGFIYMGALIWDAALDPMLGAVVDRTRSRYGRYRPYLIFGGIPLGLAFIAMMAGPAGPGTGVVLYSAVIHVAFRTLYAVAAIPYAALFAHITRDARLRADLAGFRMFFATLAAVLVAAMTMPLVEGLKTPEDPHRGWVIIGVAFGLVSTALLLLVSWAARGLDDEEAAAAPALPLPVMVRAILANRALLLVLGAVIIGSFCSTMFGKNLLYYFKYVVGNEKLASAALAVTALGTVLLVPIFAWLARTRGKRAAWLTGAVPSLIGLVLWHVVDGSSIPMLFVALGLISVGSAAYAVCFWSMLPDTVEYGEWKSGVRTESLVFGMAVLGQKIAVGLGAGFLGLALSHVGYVANAAQTPETIAGIKNMMFWIPLTGGLTAFALIWFYPLSLSLHAQIVEELAARKGGAAPSA